MFAYKKDITYIEVAEGMYPTVITSVKKNAKFIGWDSDVSVAKQDKTYVAQYKELKEFVLFTEPQKVLVWDEHVNVKG